MSSDEENMVAAPRVNNKLTLDSEQEQKREAEERQIQQQIQKRKEEKRKKREEAERLEQEKLRQQQEREKKYMQPESMFEQDSEEGVEFRRVVKKIRKMYPQQTNKHEVASKKRNDFIVPDDEDENSDESDEGSDSGDQSGSSEQQSRQKPSKKQKKQQKKERKPVEKKPVQKRKVEPQVKKQKVKIQHKSDKKDHLVKQVSVRWWYALPEWPPADFDYEGKLKELGYRVLPADKFKLEDDVVNGLQKVVAVDGYKGVYKSKTKLIDVRPKDSAPTLNNFRSKSIEQLTQLLRVALKAQIQQLSQVKYQQKGQAELLTELQRELRKIS